jgi:hypothetical protein
MENVKVCASCKFCYKGDTVAWFRSSYEWACTAKEANIAQDPVSGNWIAERRYNREQERWRAGVGACCQMRTEACKGELWKKRTLEQRLNDLWFSFLYELTSKKGV